MENENQTLGQLQQKTGKIMAITEESENIKVTFATSTGDVYFGSVGWDFEGVEGLEINDVAYLEYFEYPERGQVDFEVINKMDRVVIAGAGLPKNDEEMQFFIRREQALKTDLGYRALFVDSDRTGRPKEAFFLMENDSLLVIKYNSLSPEDLQENYTSAREYLEYKKRKLERAGEFDAIKQLADYMNTTN